jgi:hypothetical protein
MHEIIGWCRPHAAGNPSTLRALSISQTTRPCPSFEQLEKNDKSAPAETGMTCGTSDHL